LSVAPCFGVLPPASPRVLVANFLFGCGRSPAPFTAFSAGLRREDFVAVPFRRSFESSMPRLIASFLAEFAKALCWWFFCSLSWFERLLSRSAARDIANVRASKALVPCRPGISGLDSGGSSAASSPPRSGHPQTTARLWHQPARIIRTAQHRRTQKTDSPKIYMIGFYHDGLLTYPQNGKDVVLRTLHGRPGKKGQPNRV